MLRLSIKKPKPRLLERLTYPSLLKGSPDKKPVKKKAYAEAASQKAFFAWLSLNYPKYRNVCFHIQNGGKKSAEYGHHLKLQGVTPGVCDVFCSIPSKEHHGLYIEFKAPEGRTSKVQQKFIGSVIFLGYKVVVAFSVDDAINAFCEHFRNG